MLQIFISNSFTFISLKASMHFNKHIPPSKNEKKGNKNGPFFILFVYWNLKGCFMHATINS